MMRLGYRIEPHDNPGVYEESPFLGYKYTFWELQKDEKKILYRNSFGYEVPHAETHTDLPTGQATTLDKADKKMRRHMARYKKNQLKLEKRFNTHSVSGGYYEV